MNRTPFYSIERTVLLNRTCEASRLVALAPGCWCRSGQAVQHLAAERHEQGNSHAAAATAHRDATNGRLVDGNGSDAGRGGRGSAGAVGRGSVVQVRGAAGRPVVQECQAGARYANYDQRADTDEAPCSRTQLCTHTHSTRGLCTPEERTTETCDMGGAATGRLI